MISDWMRCLVEELVLRWKVLLQPICPESTLHNRFAAVTVGFMANNILPARAGEFARAYALSRVEHVRVSGALGSLVVERILDALVLICLLLASLWSPAFPTSAGISEGPLATALDTVLAGVVGVVLLLAVLVGALAPDVFAGARPSVTLFEVMPNLTMAFQVEPLGMLFALVASFLWIITTCYSIGYMRAQKEAHQTRFYACFAVAILAAIGAAMAKNMFTLFIFYELLTLSTYPLVTHHGTESAQRGGRTYLGILLFTSVAFLLLAVVWTWNIAGTLDFEPGGILKRTASDRELFVLLTLYAFGIGKAALMPFHRWLPAAMVAPTPVSALLHAVAVVKVGVFTVMKVAVYIFGTDLLSRDGLSVWLMYVAGTSSLSILFSSAFLGDRG